MKELVGIVIASLLVVGLVIIGGEIYGKRSGEKVLSASETVSISPSPTATPVPTTTPEPSSTPTPSPIPTPKPTVVPIPPATSEEINKFIERFAAQYKVNPDVLRHLAVCESGFNSRAVNGIYTGLYQFWPTTWKNNRRLMGEDADINLRFNAEESVQTAAYILSIGRIGIWPNCQP